MRLSSSPLPSRRAALAGGLGFAAWSFRPRWVHAAGARDMRLVTVILRGALDGLAAVAPIRDPDYAALHGALALRLDGPTPALPLDGFFALHPAMPAFARLFGQGEAAVVHAAATPYRERSHFDGQEVLESGQPAPGLTSSGWLNRVLLALPAGEKVRLPGLAVGTVSPLLIRGEAPLVGWAPESLPMASDDLARRLLGLYAQRDPTLAGALAAGIAGSRIAGSGMAAPKGGPGSPAGMRQAAEGAARLLAAPEGPRIAALAFDGWDTHTDEGGATGHLAKLLGGLDGAIEALRTGLGPAWADTVVLAVTEFGRTVRINGTTGTDHGTGTVALLAGGGVRGGRVLADWPGLKPASLYEGRDLRPTIDLRAIFKGVLAAHWGISEAVMAANIFPGSMDVRPAQSLFV